ncbi:AAA family ATPase [Burkholderia cepacia]|uniref:AAA family ATPase n=1 Tax=Burkholderia cepacia TaxID=292 RepID=UPI002AB6BD64|nr:AAA family ATPase [Burkholderia cepacia]
MRLEEIYVRNHRRLKETTVVFENAEQTKFLSGIYGEVGITLFAGPNGSGKTSLLSFIAQFFHRLEREPDRLETAFSITYSIDGDGGIVHRCTLSRSTGDGGVSISVDGAPLGVVRRNDRGNPVLNSGSINYSDIARFLPTNIITSAFSLHGEYPLPRSAKWIGDRRLDVYDTKNLYGINHYAFPPFSGAIGKLMGLVLANDPAIRSLETLLDARFTSEIKIIEREYSASEEEWVIATPEILERERKGEIYINDFLIESESTLLTLSNMSSGQKMLMIRLLSILGKIQHGSIVIIEEPEVHLDSNWSRQLISLLLAFFSRYRAHLLIATHSFSLLNAVPRDWIFIAQRGHFSKPTRPTLLANEASLSDALFSPRPHVVEERVMEYSSQATASELENLFMQLGESSAKFEIFKQLTKKKK